jgi:hypothetical protein
MGCGGSKNMTFSKDGKQFTVTPKEKKAIEKWGLGSLARRKFKKLVQV